MPEPEMPPGTAPRSDQEKSASFDELMRIEQSQNRLPISGLAVAALGFAVAFTALAYFFGVFTLVIGAAAFVFGAFSLPQIKHSERRGRGFVLAALVVLAGGVAIIMIALNQLDQSI